MGISDNVVNIFTVRVYNQICTERTISYELIYSIKHYEKSRYWFWFSKENHSFPMRTKN